LHRRVEHLERTTVRTAFSHRWIWVK
jgi:hypothetical protein